MMIKLFKNLFVVLLVWLIGGWPAIAFALPQDGQVVGGDASGAITSPTDPNGPTMQIDQYQQQMIINWQSFNIGSTEWVNFSQPNTSAIALNRVIGSDPSLLLGKLTANGQVFISNGSGVFFGPNSQVDTHGLVATTMGISDQDFIDGNYNFTQDPSNLSSVINEGNISATSYVGLLAPAVENRGTIVTASLGSIDLASGKAATMDFTGDGLIQFEVTEAVSGTVLDKDGNELEDRVSNKGLLQADGGQIRMSAKDAGDVIRHVVNMEGMIKANTVVEKDGKVFLMGGDSGVVNVSGTIDASGDDAGEKGGTVDVQADTLLHSGTILASGDTEGGTVNIDANKIQQSGSIEADGSNGTGGDVDIDFAENYIATQASKLSATGYDADGGSISINGGATGRLFTSGEMDASSNNGIGGSLELFGNEVLLVAARLDASGDNGGGSIYIGGDFQGQGTVPLSNATTVTGATTINADAKQNGNGGEVVVWSEGTTDFYGTATARGGAVSGNGGTIEVSGKGNLAIAGTTDASAANGVKGTLLLDPKNIIVDDSSGGLPFFDLIDPNANGTSYGDTIATLANGNIVVLDINDNFGATAAGAVYLYNGATGALINSVTGTSASDQIGSGQGIKELTGGNFVISSPNWDNGGAANAGAVTVISGTLGTTVTGAGTTVTTSNSLHGTTVNDLVGISTIATLSNGNFAVGSAFWNGGVVDAGAVTLVSGTTGQAVADSSFVVSTSNSLHGTTANDQIGNNSTTALSNGNYVVTSQTWDGAATDVGAATLVSGTTGRALADSSFVVSTSNSLHGTTASDQVGRGNITELTNGNYAVISQDWNGVVSTGGAVTLVSGTTGSAVANSSFTISSSNSVHGTTAGDMVGALGVISLSNGNFVTSTQVWDGAAADVGAVTLVSGTTGQAVADSSFVVSTSNSLHGTTANDQVSNKGVTALANGNFVVASNLWDGGAVDTGAVTLVSGTAGSAVEDSAFAVSTSNSLHGSNASDGIGSNGVTALTGSNYVVSSQNWRNGATLSAGAVTLVQGTGANAGKALADDSFTVSTSNSIHGDKTSDLVGLGGTFELTNGNIVVVSPRWANGGAITAGAVTLMSATTGQAIADSSFTVSTANSLHGTTTGDQIGETNPGVGGLEFSNSNFLIQSSEWNDGATTTAGAVTLVSGTTGRGLIDGSFTVSAKNSLIGTSVAAGTGNQVIDTTNNFFAAQFKDNTTNRIRVAPLNDPTFALASGDTYTIHSGFITNTLDGGTAVTLQASNDITINSAIIANNGSGAGGDLILQAGRSVLINANITTDDGNLIIIANDLLANGVVDAQRDSGAAAITMGGGTTLNTGSGNLAITLRDGAGKTNSASGLITLETITTTGTVSVTGTNGILFNQSLSGIGAFTAEGDSNNSVDGTDSITFAGGVNVSSTGSISLDATTGGISLAGTSTFSATSGMTVNDTLSITTGTAIFSSTTSIANLTLSGGTLQVDGAVSVTNSFDWQTGASTISGSNIFTTGNFAQTMSDNGTKTLDGVTWNNQGTMVMSGGFGSAFAVTNGATFNNSNSFEISSASDITGSGGGTFNNSGTFTYSSASNRSVATTFNNTGTVVVSNTGRLTFTVAAGATDNGTYNVSNVSGKIVFNNTRTFGSSADFQGTGTVEWAGANAIDTSNLASTLLIEIGGSGTTTLNNTNTVASLTLSGGDLIISSGVTLTTSTGFTWTGASNVSGLGTLITDTGVSGSILDNSATKVLSGSSMVWTNRGDITFSGGTGFHFTLDSGATLNNEGTFTITATAGSNILSTGGTNTINNTGTFTHNTTSNTTVNPEFNNLTGGSVSATNTGTLNIANGNTTAISDIGDYSVTNASGGINFNGGTRTFTSTVGFTGSGDFTFSAGGTTTFTNVTMNNTGTVTLSGTTLTTGGTNLSITANDIAISSALTATGADVTIIAASGGIINVGATAGAMQIDNTELNLITAANVNIGDATTGAITVNGLTGNAAITDTLTLTSGSTVDSDTGSSTVTNNLAVVAGGNISQSAALFVGGTSSFTVSGSSTITLANPNVFTGAITLVSSGGDVQLTNNSATTITSATTSGGNLSLAVLDITITSINAGAGDVSITGFGGLTIGLGATAGTIHITGAELQNITAANLTIGDANDGTITVDGITAAHSGNISGTITLNATNTASAVDFSNTASVFNGALTVNAENGVNVNVGLTTNGTTTIDADSDDDGTGSLTVADSQTVNTTNNNLSISGGDFNLNTSGALNAGTGDVTLLASSGRTIGVGAGGLNFDIENVELGNITANNLTIGNNISSHITVDGVTAANTANISGTITLDATAAATTLTFSGSASVFSTALTANAENGITVSQNVTSNSGGVSFNADSDNDGTGTLTVANTFTINSTNQSLSIIAGDLDLNTTGALDAGTGNLSITQSTTGSIGLGDNNCGGTCGMTITGAELQNITAANLTLTTVTGVSSIFVDNITAANSNNIGTVILDSTGDDSNIVFTGTESFFNALTANADNGINFLVNLTTDTGNMVLDGDSDDSADSADNINFSALVTLNSAGTLVMSGTTGGISPSAGGTFTAASGITINDTFFISAGTTIFSSATSINDLNMAGGTLTANAAVSVTSGLTLAAGTINGSGSFATTTGVTAGSITASSTAVNLDTITWNNAGTITFSGSGNDIVFANGAILNNSGTFNMSASSTLSEITGTGTFNNSGTLATGDSPSQEIFTTFNNTGQVNIVTGDLNIVGTGTGNSGDYDVSSGRSLFFSSGRTFDSTTDFTGSGTVDWNTGTQTLNTSSFASTLTAQVSGGQADFTTDTTLGTLSVTGGTLNLNGATVDLTVTSGFSWTGGTIQGTAGSTLTTTSGVTAGTIDTSSAAVVLDTVGWDNFGTLSFSGTAAPDFAIDNNAVFTNKSGANFNLINTSATALITTLAGTGTFTNEGTVTKTAGTATTFSTTNFNNTGGTVNTTTGTINISSNGTDTGIYDAGSGTTINFDTGTRTFNNVSITGAGTIDFTAGGTFDTNNTNLSITAADVNVDVGLNVGTGTLTISSAGGNIGLGVGAGVMTITDAQLLNITADTLNIGNNTDGAMDINSVTTGGIANIATNINFASGSNIAFAGNSMAFFNDAKLSTISAALGTVTVPGTAAGTIGLGDADCGSSCTFSITGAKLATITASTLLVGDTNSDNVFVDNVTAANTANIATVRLEATATNKTITFTGSDSTFQGLTLNADDGITLSRNVTTTGTTLIDADVDNDSVGDFTVATGFTLNTTNNNVQITAKDFTLTGTAALNAGTGDVTIIISNPAANIAVGDDAVGGLKVDDQELGRITANNLNIGDSAMSGNINVDAVTLAGTNITSLNLINGSTGGVSFDGTRLSTTTANLSVTSGTGGISQSVHTIVGGTTTSFTSTGDITMNDASNSLSSNLTIVAGRSFDVDPGATTTLTDLSVTVDPAGACGTCTYVLDISNIGNVSAFTLSDTGANVSVGAMTATALNLSLTTGSGQVITSGAINVGTGSFSLTTNGNIDAAMIISNTITAGSLVLDANGQQSDVAVNADINITDGSVSITADDSVTFAAGVDLVASGAGNVTVESNTDTLDGSSQDDLVMDDDSGIDAGSGTITLTSTGTGAGNITVAELKTTSSSSSAISVNSISTVFDAGDTRTSNFNAVNGGVVLVGGSSLGNSGATSLEFDVASLDATNSANSLFANLQSDVSITQLNIFNQANFIGTGSITQTGAISAVALTANTNGTITLTNTSNNVTSVSFSTTGNIDYVDADAFTVNTTNSVVGVSSGSGANIKLTATTGQVTITSAVTSTAGDIAITADKMDIVAAVSASGQRVKLKSSTADDAVDLGSGLDSALNTLELSDTELDLITANYLEIGSTTQGAITVSGDISPANIMVLHLISNSTVTGTAGGIVVAQLAIEAGGKVDISDTTTDVDLLAINATGQDVTFFDTDDLDINTVDTVVGVKAASFTTPGPGPLTATEAILLDSAEEEPVSTTVSTPGAPGGPPADPTPFAPPELPGC